MNPPQVPREECISVPRQECKQVIITSLSMIHLLLDLILRFPRLSVRTSRGPAVLMFPERSVRQRYKNSFLFLDLPAKFKVQRMKWRIPFDFC